MSRAAADLVLLLHFAFTLFVVFGGFLILLSRAWIWIHLPLVVWASAVNLGGWTCPLTPLEKRFRSEAGQVYEGGFVRHYIATRFNADMPQRRVDIVTGVVVIVWNVVVYGLVLWLR